MSSNKEPYQHIVEDGPTTGEADRINGKERQRQFSNCFVEVTDPDILRIIGSTHNYIIKCDEEMAPSVYCSPYEVLLIPCLWMAGVILAPILCIGRKKAVAAAKGTYYIITDKALITLTKSYDIGCGTTGDDYKVINLDTIQSLEVDNRRSGICGSFSVLNILTSADKWGGEHGDIRIPTKLIVNNPREISELIQGVTDDMAHNVEHKVQAPLYEEDGVIGPSSKQSETKPPASKIRVFVATKQDPTDFKLVVFSGGNSTEFWDKVHKVFGSDCNQIHLAAEGVLLDDVDGIQNNDKLIVS